MIPVILLKNQRFFMFFVPIYYDGVFTFPQRVMDINVNTLPQVLYLLLALHTLKKKEVFN